MYSKVTLGLLVTLTVSEGGGKKFHHDNEGGAKNVRGKKGVKIFADYGKITPLPRFNSMRKMWECQCQCVFVYVGLSV